jgi:ferritin
LKTPRDQVQEGLYAQTIIEKLDHFFKTESRLFARDRQLADREY